MLELRIHARIAMDIYDIIKANNLKNPDPIIFSEVAKQVYLESGDKLSKMLSD